MYDGFAKKIGADDLQKQVLRTIDGQAVPPEQIELIHQAIISGLQLSRTDHLIELACGNGCLSDAFMKGCETYVGIDVSDTLIEVAKAQFEAAPRIAFVQADALEWLRNARGPERFNKLLCYAAVQYFPDAMVHELLTCLLERFPNVRHVFFGNLPDLEQADHFLSKKRTKDLDLRSNETPIGIWRSQKEFTTLCQNSGWNVEFSRMPKAFYASAYRYDAVLHPLDKP